MHKKSRHLKPHLYLSMTRILIFSNDRLTSNGAISPFLDLYSLLLNILFLCNVSAGFHKDVRSSGSGVVFCTAAYTRGPQFKLIGNKDFVEIPGSILLLTIPSATLLR
jgi:hypothetical protein